MPEPLTVYNLQLQPVLGFFVALEIQLLQLHNTVHQAHGLVHLAPPPRPLAVSAVPVGTIAIPVAAVAAAVAAATTRRLSGSGSVLGWLMAFFTTCCTQWGCVVVQELAQLLDVPSRGTSRRVPSKHLGSQRFRVGLVFLREGLVLHIPVDTTGLDGLGHIRHCCELVGHLLSFVETLAIVVIDWLPVASTKASTWPLFPALFLG
jgi:hypothetical protein